MLVGVDLGEYDCEASLDELEELAKTAGAEVEARVTQRRETPDSATFIGSGRLKEIKNFCADNDVDLLIFDSELTPSQQRNIEDITDVRVVDRTQLILEISAEAGNFVPLKTPANSGFSKFQIEYFYVFSPAFLSKRFCELKTGGNIRRCTQAVEGSALEMR